MNKLSRLVIVAVMTAVLVGCATGGNLPKQIPDALNAACDLYTKAKPEIIRLRAYAVAHWDEKVPGTDRDVIPSEVKGVLLELDKLAPQLDTAGLALCSASEGVNAFATAGSGGKVDWDQVLTVVLKGASMAIDLKAKGAI